MVWIYYYTSNSSKFCNNGNSFTLPHSGFGLHVHRWQQKHIAISVNPLINSAFLHQCNFLTHLNFHAVSVSSYYSQPPPGASLSQLLLTKSYLFLRLSVGCLFNSHDPRFTRFLMVSHHQITKRTFTVASNPSKVSIL